MGSSLVLNATYEPLGVVSYRRAVVLILSEKAEPVQKADRVFHSERLVLPVPSVVRLVRYVRVPYRRRVALNRRSVMARDGGRCQYCGTGADTIDHVVPRSRGGAHTWDNVVAACRRCNSHKGNHLLSETALRLRRPPAEPLHLTWLRLSVGRIPVDWEPYLGAEHELTA